MPLYGARLDESSKFAKDVFAARTRTVVASLGLSQREIARRTGVTGAFVSAICRNESLPSMTFAGGLRDAFGISLDWYFLGEGPIFKPGSEPSTDAAAVLKRAALEDDPGRRLRAGLDHLRAQLPARDASLVLREEAHRQRQKPTAGELLDEASRSLSVRYSPSAPEPMGVAEPPAIFIAVSSEDAQELVRSLQTVLRVGDPATISRLRGYLEAIEGEVVRSAASVPEQKVSGG